MKRLLNCLFVSLAILSLSSFTFAASVWTTDAYGNPKLDFAPSEPVFIHGSGFAANSDVAVSVTDPFSSTSTGTVISDSSGNFVYDYLLLKSFGTYNVFASDGLNSVSFVFTDAAAFSIKITQPTNASLTTNPVRVFGKWNVTDNPPGQLDQYNVQIQWGDGTNTSAVNINRTEIGKKDAFLGNFDTEFISGCNASDGTDNCTNGNFTHKYNISQSGCGPFNITVKLYHQNPPGNEAGDAVAIARIGITEICNNGINDDCDNLTDCADPDCTGNPVCGFCGNGIIEAGEDCDPGGNYTNDCCTNACKFETNAYTCRASTGVCDIAETCTGSSATCPTNNFRPYGYVCAYESGQCEADDICDGFSAVCNEKYALSGTSCNDNLYCNVGETCNGMGSCTGGSPRDCSDGAECTYDNCDETNDVCDNSNKPYGTECGSARDCPFDACSNPFWYDYNDDGHDYCSSGICIIWKCGYTSTCETGCGASCESDSDCTSYCSNNGRYYNGDCESSCSCSYSYESCGTQTRTCTLGENCACESGKYFCDTGDEKSCENGCTSGNCNPPCTPNSCDRTNQGTDSDGDGYDNECETCDNTYCRQSPTAEICNNRCDDDCDGYTDCADSECDGETGPTGKECCQSASTCDDSNICTDDACTANECIYTNNNDPCEDGQYCTVNDACSGGSCVSGSARDCSGNNLPTIDECGYVPDSNPFTIDYAPGFTSTCDEGKNECTSGSYSFTHTCSVPRCGAECDPSSSQKRCLPEGTSIVTVMNGKCYITPEFDTCYSNCTWSNCQKIEIPIDDPRCNIIVTKPTCGGTTGISCTTTTTRTTTTVPKTTTTFYMPRFTIPTFTFPKFTLPTFSFPSFSFR